MATDSSAELWTYADALAGGRTPEAVRWAVSAGRWQRVFRGVYAPGGIELSTALRVRAAILSTGFEEGAASLTTAADLHGFGVIGDRITHLAGPPGTDHSPQPGLRVHAYAGTLDRELVGGVPCTGPDRTAVDLARLLPRLDAIAVLDAAIRSGRCTNESLMRALTRHAGLRGVVQARELVPLADGRAESPMESRLRLKAVDGGLPTPEVQWRIYDRGVERYRLDLAWPQWRVGVEYDGAPAHLERSQLRYDRARHNWLTAVAGWQLLYFTDVDIYRNHERMLQMIWTELARAA